MPCFSTIGIVTTDSSVLLSCPISDTALVKFLVKKEDSLVKDIQINLYSYKIPW